MKTEHPGLTKKRKEFQKARRDMLDYADTKDWKAKQKIYKKVSQIRLNYL